ncbi:MAG: hypothetical protein JSS16_06370 [Proteobacteria bacterium]|uniref:hypothetical protein n=1 Tax=Rudaea sp. TaxID=2136325 RepID=UPI001DF21A47|nr:hypothetical protein [Pseudomonadota bacterium]MBS0568705.1 hypothetical protein [Pseudomonadota bacterium]
MTRSARRIAMVLAVLLATPLAARADVSVGAGSTLHFADAKVDFGCGRLGVNGTADATAATLSDLASFSLVGGTFALGSGTLSLGGDFSNAGAFAADTGTVAVGDACAGGSSIFNGANTFYALSIATSAGKQVIFPVGLAQSVEHALILQGAPGRLLRITSASAGRQGVLALAAGATQTVAYVDARDNLASVTPIAPGAPSLYQSIDGGDLTHWFDAVGGGAAGGTAVPAPLLGRCALLLLAALLAASDARRRIAQAATNRDRRPQRRSADPLDIDDRKIP